MFLIDFIYFVQLDIKASVRPISGSATNEQNLTSLSTNVGHRNRYGSFAHNARSFHSFLRTVPFCLFRPSVLLPFHLYRFAKVNSIQLKMSVCAFFQRSSEVVGCPSHDRSTGKYYSLSCMRCGVRCNLLCNCYGNCVIEACGSITLKSFQNCR